MDSMGDRPHIDPALGLDLVQERTLEPTSGSVSVLIPAHNEAETITEVVSSAWKGLGLLQVQGEVIVSASACTDATIELAEAAGAKVFSSPAGKGAAVMRGLAETSGEIICLLDGDVRYYGDPPLVTILVDPIRRGVADACITDLYWRPLYPQMWLYAFFTPLAGALFPELLPKAGSTPWSGQRAAVRSLWPSKLPTGFTMDLELLLHWNRHALRLRPVLSDDWMNPQRPKPDLMVAELATIIEYAVAEGRLESEDAESLMTWYSQIHEVMASYRPDEDNVQEFELYILEESLSKLRALLRSMGTAG